MFYTEFQSELNELNKSIIPQLIKNTYQNKTPPARQVTTHKPRRNGGGHYMQSRQAAPMVPAALPSVARIAGGQPMMSDANTYFGSFSLSGIIR